MKKQGDAEPWLNCLRCGGSGLVTIAGAGDYIVEDSSPRELPITTCERCGGVGQVRPKGSDA